MCLARWQIFSFDLDEPFQLKRHVASPFLSGTVIPVAVVDEVRGS